MAQAGFLLAVVGFAGWGLHGRWSDIVAAMSLRSPAQLLGAFLFTALAVCTLLPVWRLLLASFGHDVRPRDANAVFFIGQLGKYLPGSVWILGAQAHLARRHGIPARTTVAAGLMLVAVVGSTAVIAMVAYAATSVWPVWVYAAAAVAVAVAVATLTPPSLHRVGRALAGPESRMSLAWTDSARVGGWLILTWIAYGVSIAVLFGRADEPEGLLLCIGAYAVAHLAGLLLVVAPAGIGAREGVLVALLAPTYGVSLSVAVAILSRVLNTVVDFGAAALVWVHQRVAG